LLSTLALAIKGKTAEGEGMGLEGKGEMGVAEESAPHKHQNLTSPMWYINIYKKSIVFFKA
jgi:hypothetical protein